MFATVFEKGDQVTISRCWVKETLTNHLIGPELGLGEGQGEGFTYDIPFDKTLMNHRMNRKTLAFMARIQQLPPKTVARRTRTNEPVEFEK